MDYFWNLVAIVVGTLVIVSFALLGSSESEVVYFIVGACVGGAMMYIGGDDEHK